MKLKDKIAIVTGAGQGLGRAIALMLGEEGAVVAVVGRTTSKLESVAAEITQAGGRAWPITADLTEEDQVQGMVDQVMEKYGRIDILVNNAGGYPKEMYDISTQSPLKIWEWKPEQWDQIIRTNLRIPFLCMNKVTPVMREQGFGDIVSISSRMGRIASEMGAYAVAKGGIVTKPEGIAPAEAPAAAPVARQGAIPEGTVLGDGHIKIAHVRVDTRLLHGQVATTWTKTVSPDRIIVVSDGVAHDQLRKTMIEQAAPPGVPANVVPISKMIEVTKDPRFGATKAMLLFENPQDLLAAIEGGVDIKEANIGSMAHSVGKVVVTNAIAMDNADVETLETLHAKGVALEARKVPSDSPVSYEDLIKKAKSELASA